MKTHLLLLCTIVLLIDDSVSGGYTLSTRKALAGQANWPASK